MVILVTGVSGAGKTTVGKQLAATLGWRFFDADDLHTPASVEKMRGGVALTEEDRAPWLLRVGEVIALALAGEESLVVAVSALRASHRALLVKDPARVKVVFLTAPPSLIGLRLSQRAGHFMPPTLLESQLAALEPPADALEIEVSAEPEQLAERIRAGLGI